MSDQLLPITCPLCGRKYERAVAALFEGAELVCPYCNVKLTLHGHMWKDIQNEIADLNRKN